MVILYFANLLLLNKEGALDMKHLLNSLGDLAELKGINVRTEARMWESLSRDLKREAKRIEEERKDRATRPKIQHPENEYIEDDRLYVRVAEATKMMGMGHTSLYKEISEERLPIKKSGKKTLIAVKDIHAWFDALPDKG